MTKLIMVFASFILLTGCMVKDKHSIVGEWQLIESSFPLSGLCRTATVHFTEDGMLLSKSGLLQEKKSYTIKPYKKGFLVETQHISDNGMINCQGMSASLARKNPVKKIYLESINEGRNLKMHFHPEKDKGYLVVERA